MVHVTPIFLVFFVYIYIIWPHIIIICGVGSCLGGGGGGVTVCCFFGVVLYKNVTQSYYFGIYIEQKGNSQSKYVLFGELTIYIYINIIIDIITLSLFYH